LRIVPALIIALGLLLASLIVVFVPRFLPSAGGATGGTSTVDSQARIEIELLRGEITAAREGLSMLVERLDSLEGAVSNLSLPPVAPPPTDGTFAIAPRTGPNVIADSYAEIVQVADRRNLNIGLTVPTPRFLVEQLGMPRQDLSQDCQPITNPGLAALVETRTVGPITVQMLSPALDSLERIFALIEASDADLYARMATAGALCVRYIRGSSTSVSTHSFGLAVDLNIDGVTDTLGDGMTQIGLTILADFFNAEGWIWGAAYGREDSMHFEVSQEKVLEWIDQGLLPRAQ
jgi:hypothetical protein